MRPSRLGPLLAAALALAAGLAWASPATLSSPAPMSWLISGERGSIYVLGTMHVGSGPRQGLSGPTAAAFAKAGTLLAELSGEDYANAGPASIRLIQASLLPDGASIEGRLSPACREVALSLVGAEGFAALCRFEPWVLSLALVQGVYAQAGLDARYGIDPLVYGLAGERPVLGLESLDAQLALLDEGSVEEQLASLEAAVPRIADGSSIQESIDLVKAYEADDRERVAALVASSIEESLRANPADAASIDRMFGERNAAWAERLAACLERGGDYFIFAGVGHFLGEGNVFEEMHELGALR
ncbi:MAG TPA: TraB/GumN family protein [Spirochaetia bacterium]|nr:TraB/GumN family protein [Spirochaetia bacterium]